LETASANLSKRFKLLFVLPRSTKALVGAYLAVSFAVVALYESSFGFALPTSLLTIGSIAVLQVAVLKIIHVSSYHLSTFATLRRVAASLTIINMTTLVLSSISLSLKGFSPHVAGIILVFVSFISLALGIFIFWPVFTDYLHTSLAISIVNVLPLWLMLLFHSNHQTSGLLLPSLLGSLFLGLMTTFLAFIDTISKRLIGLSTFKLLKAFLDSWINLNSTQIEKILTSFTEDSATLTYILQFVADDGKKPTVVVPEVHPGPFAPVGSFDLPGKIHWYLQSKVQESPMVLHGVVDHSYNLVTSQDVENYLSQLATPSNEGISINKISEPVMVTSGKAVVSGLRLGDSILIFISVPTGCEDYPPSFRETAKNICAGAGYTKAILVDAHNAIGEEPSAQLQTDAMEGIKQVAMQLFTAPSFEFRVGYASKRYAPSFTGNSDLGVGGLSCLMISVNGVEYSLVSADANNCIVGLRHKVAVVASQESTKLLEFCTSDSHFNAARIRNRRGYLVLGESTPSERILNDIQALIRQAKTSLTKSTLNLHQRVLRVKLPKRDMLLTMEKVLSQALEATRSGLLILFTILMLEWFVLLWSV
jgi:putative membrane protein